MAPLVPLVPPTLKEVNIMDQESLIWGKNVFVTPDSIRYTIENKLYQPYEFQNFVSQIDNFFTKTQKFETDFISISKGISATLKLIVKLVLFKGVCSI